MGDEATESWEWDSLAGWISNFSNVSDLLVGAFLVSKVERHPEVFQMMTSVMAQFGNLFEYLLPDVAIKNPATFPRQPHRHIDKGMIQMWVSKLLEKSSFQSLPALLRSMDMCGVSPLCTRGNKDSVFGGRADVVGAFQYFIFHTGIHGCRCFQFFAYDGLISGRQISVDKVQIINFMC